MEKENVCTEKKIQLFFNSTHSSLFQRLVRS